MLRILKGVLSLSLYTLNLLFWALIILCIYALTFLCPKSWKEKINRHFLQKTPEWFAKINSFIMQISTKKLWDISGTGTLDKNGWYLMISNHQSWLDILVLGNIFADKIPPLKFFMKKELLWQLPFAGLACYALGYPFMSRHSHAEIRKNPALKGKDVETTKKACQVLRIFPSTLINFVEGTRFTPNKHAKQLSPFKHLLKPRTGGISIVLQELNDILSGIVNVTIHYGHKPPTVWEFACGHFEKITIRYEVIPLTPELIGDYYSDRHFRSHIQQWLNTLWKSNDEFIEGVGKR